MCILDLAADRSANKLVDSLDDPLIWGILPARYAFDPDNLRWGLGAHDICFKNKYARQLALERRKLYADNRHRFTTNFFSLGQVLPTHRAWHSPHGGLYQPTMAQAIRLLSGPVANPIIAPGTKYSTDGSDSHLVPSVYESAQKAWVHIFPEACCHQNPESTLRYFKWGVSRLILESDPAPEFIPMFIHGTQHIMAEDRGFPRFLPRVGKTFRVMIGEPTDVNALFGEYRARWRALKEKASDEELKTKPEAVQLRIEVASKVRDEIAKLREKAGFPADDDETAGLADTWTQEPNVRKFKSPVDGSLVNRH